MQAAKPVAESDRDAFLNDIAAELGQHEVIGPGLLHRIISEVQRRYDIADQRRSTGVIPLNEAAGIEAMPLSPEQEVLCERAEKGEPVPRAAALIRQQAYQIDDLWDRLSRAYALVRRESPAEMIQEEMEALQAMLEGKKFLCGALKQISQQRVSGAFSEEGSYRVGGRGPAVRRCSTN